MFAKVARIVTRWYGSPTNKDILPEMIDDAIYAWKTGYFEGTDVFLAADPGGATFLQGKKQKEDSHPNEREEAPSVETSDEPTKENSIGTAEMRIDLSRVLGK